MTTARPSPSNVCHFPAVSASDEASGRTLHERLLQEARDHVHEAATAPDENSPARRNFLRLVMGGQAAALALAACAAMIAVVDPSVHNGVWTILTGVTGAA